MDARGPIEGRPRRQAIAETPSISLDLFRGRTLQMRCRVAVAPCWRPARVSRRFDQFDERDWNRGRHARSAWSAPASYAIAAPPTRDRADRQSVDDLAPTCRLVIQRELRTPMLDGPVGDMSSMMARLRIHVSSVKLRPLEASINITSKMTAIGDDATAATWAAQRQTTVMLAVEEHVDGSRRHGVSDTRTKTSCR